MSAWTRTHKGRTITAAKRPGGGWVGWIGPVSGPGQFQMRTRNEVFRVAAEHINAEMAKPTEGVTRC